MTTLTDLITDGGFNKEVLQDHLDCLGIPETSDWVDELIELLPEEADLFRSTWNEVVLGWGEDDLLK